MINLICRGKNNNVPDVFLQNILYDDARRAGQIPDHIYHFMASVMASPERK